MLKGRGEVTEVLSLGVWKGGGVLPAETETLGTQVVREREGKGFK